DGRIYHTDPKRIGRVEAESYPADFSLTSAYPQVITDHAGGLWLGSRQKLARLWHGKFVRVEPTQGLPEIDPRSFFMDSRGWLWIGMRYKGVSLTKEPGAENPQFINYSTGNGLSSETVWTITEDALGRMYFGTGRGLDRYDPNANQWRHFTTKDGLSSD